MAKSTTAASSPGANLASRAANARGNSSNRAASEPSEQISCCNSLLISWCIRSATSLQSIRKHTIRSYLFQRSAATLCCGAADFQGWGQLQTELDALPVDGDLFTKPICGWSRLWYAVISNHSRNSTLPSDGG